MFMSMKLHQWDGLMPEGHSEFLVLASLLTFFNSFSTFGKKKTDGNRWLLSGADVEHGFMKLMGML